MPQSITLTQDQISCLIKTALDQAKKAYAPYSQYHVGSGVLTASGDIYPGCNVENCCYPMTTCAERTAVCTAVAQGHRVIRAVSICAPGKDGGWPLPCGSCCQMMAEFEDKEDPDVDIILVKPSGEHSLTSLSHFYPHRFSKDFLLNKEETK